MTDTDLCTGDSCPIKEKCLRYKLYQRALNHPDGTEYHYHVEPSYTKEGCVNFLLKE